MFRFFQTGSYKDHSLTSQEQQVAKDLLAKAEESSAFGPLEERRSQVLTPNGARIFLSRRQGFTEQTGELLREQTDEFHMLSCGSVISDPNSLVVCSYSDELISRSKAVTCQRCQRPVWIHYARKLGSKILCRSCRRVEVWKLPVTVLFACLTTIALGLCGKERPSRDQEPRLIPNEQIPPIASRRPQRYPSQADRAGQTRRPFPGR